MALVFFARFASHAAARPRPAMRSKEPALKKTSAFVVSRAKSAHRTVPMAGIPAASAIHFPQLLSFGLGLWTSPASNSRAGRLACLRNARPMTTVETAILAESAVLNVAGAAGNESDEGPTVLRQIVGRPQSIALAQPSPANGPSTPASIPRVRQS